VTTGCTTRRTWSGCASSRACATTPAFRWRRSPSCSRTRPLVSLAEIAQLLEDEAARERGHAEFHATTDPAERKRLLCERVASFERQIETLQRKIGRLKAMVDDTESRRVRTAATVAELGSREP